MTPYAGADRDLRVQLNAHLEIALQGGLRDRIGARGGGVALEATDHGFVIALLGRLRRRGGGGAVDGFVEDRVVRVVFLHGAEVGGAFEEMLALPGGVLCADGLTVDALRRQAL